MSAAVTATATANAGPVLHLDYATRDYDGFVQLLTQLVDRQGTAWTERAAADLGIMVIELLAYELDRLAYAGDRVAEEGFLATARRRESVRRHAALGDYVLDRGNATRGYQWFQLAPGQTIALPARTQVAAPIDPGSPGELRLIAETLDAASLDARRNSFVLAQAALAGTRVLRLAKPDRTQVTQPDLRSLGLAAGMTLIVGTPLVPGVALGAVTADDPPVQLALGEAVQIATVMAHGVELVTALHHTWPGGSDGAWVLGNAVEIRRGQTSGWTLIGRGGAALGEIAHPRYLQLRMELVRRLRAEVEDARPAWSARPALQALWTEACQSVTDLRRALLAIDLAAYDVRVPAQLAELQAFDATLARAADQLRSILTAIGQVVPDELAVSTRVIVPGQTIDLPITEQPVLWMDRDPAEADPDLPARTDTLTVAVGIAGAWSRWSERPDLLRSAPDDHHFVVEIDGSSNLTLRFGDGITGAALPAGCQVMVRWVTGDETGDPAGDDIRAGALSTVLTPSTATPGQRAQLAAITATSNPLATTGGRPPERLDGIAARVEQNLEIPAVPVTAADYRELVTDRAGIAESTIRVAHGVVDIVIRPAPGAAASQLLDATRAWLDANRLAGATLTVRLPRPLAIDIGVVVDVHPDVSAADLRYRVQRALADSFGDSAAQALGRPRERAEVYRLVEAIPGVLWSQVIAFDVAGTAPLHVREVITPADDQIVRCAGLDDQPASGQIAIWAARRFALQLTVRYATLDTRPDLAGIRQLVPALLSGPAGRPAQQGWTALTAARIDDALADVFASAGFTVNVTRLIADRRAVDEIDIADRELAILDTITVVDQTAPPFGGAAARGQAPVVDGGQATQAVPA